MDYYFYETGKQQPEYSKREAASCLSKNLKSD